MLSNPITVTIIICSHSESEWKLEIFSFCTCFLTYVVKSLQSLQHSRLAKKLGICDMDTFWIATWTICSSIKHVYHLILHHGLLTQRYGMNECKCIEDTL